MHASCIPTLAFRDTGAGASNPTTQIVPAGYRVRNKVGTADGCVRPTRKARRMTFVADGVAPHKKVRRVEFIDAILKSPRERSWAENFETDSGIMLLEHRCDEVPARSARLRHGSRRPHLAGQLIQQLRSQCCDVPRPHGDDDVA